MTRPPLHGIAEPKLNRAEPAPGASQTTARRRFKASTTDLEHAQTSSRSIQPSRRSMAQRLVITRKTDRDRT
jgi:hypothetical protein